jgi:ABC-type branched-subunit amino acid transport system substrate-binding protein
MKALKIVRYVCVLVFALTFLLSPTVSFSEPVKIGAMFISSGKMGGYGKHGRRAIQLAVDQINADGGVLGRNMEAIV